VHKLTLTFLLLLAATRLHAGPLEDGFKAYDSGRYQQAMQLWLPLAKQNNPDALYNVGLLYMKGQGAQKDPRAAIDWFKRAANYGSLDAAYNLGVLYKTGEGVFPSNKDAIYWWKQAADAGHAQSQYNMGVMAAYGYGMGKDVDRAIRYWEQAARQGQPESRQLLYKIYSEGLLGIAPNPQKAARWK
jgi:hypothetical protein